MVQQGGITYVVRHKGKKFEITKEALKRRNLEIVREYKTADPDRRGELFQEYYDLNKPFISYFPMFNGEYRDEIIQIFVSKIPEAFLAFDESVGIDVNSYLGMFFKKHAVRDFLYLLPTVQYNKFVRDETGKRTVEKAHVISIDSLRSSEQDSDSESGMDGLMGEFVFDEFLNGGQRDGEEQFLEGVTSYTHKFSDPQTAAIVKDFEDGLRFNEVFAKYKIPIDRFLFLISAIRMQLSRIIKQEGKDVKFVTKQERGERKRSAVARENQRANVGAVPRGVGASDGVARLLEWINGIHADPVQRDEGYRPKTAVSMEDVWEGERDLGGEG